VFEHPRQLENASLNKRTNMGYVNYSIYWPDPKLLRRIKAAAKEQKVSPSVFVRSAAEKALAEHEKKRSRKQQRDDKRAGEKRASEKRAA
jgi:hypothetical protein